MLGELGEPMLRLGHGVWVNLSSPTAQVDRLVRRPEKGWKKVADGRGFAWHENRLAPPRFAAGRYGAVARWRVPLIVNGHRTAITGTFWRIPRPTFWPWALGVAAVILLAVVAMRFRPRLRHATSIGAGVVAGVAGLTAQSAFSLRDAPSGHIAWALLIAAFALATIATFALAVAHGEERAFVGAAIGVGTLAFCLSWVGVFFHGAVISALPAQAARLTCAVAFTAGLISLIGVLWLDSPSSGRQRSPVTAAN